MTNSIIAIVAAVILLFLSVVFAGVWVYRDAKQRGLQAGLWTLLVVLSGNFIGLILYLLIGRKQARAICDKCGSATDTNGAFCSVCGEKITMRNNIVKTNKTMLIACVICIILAFVSVGLCFTSAIGADGFNFEWQYGYYQYGKNGSAKKVSQSSSGDKWSLSFEEVSDGYVFNKTYNAKSKPSSLTVEIPQCAGSVQLMITQNGASIIEAIGEGSYSFDLSEFDAGKINIKIISISASDFSGVLTMIQ